MTNGDRIRQMADEELADILSDKCASCDYQYGRCDSEYCICREGVLVWLKKEADEDDAERAN